MVAQRALPAALGMASHAKPLCNVQRVPCHMGSWAARGMASGAGSGKWALPKNEANFTALSPLSFLKRVERVQVPASCIEDPDPGCRPASWGEGLPSALKAPHCTTLTLLSHRLSK